MDPDFFPSNFIDPAPVAKNASLTLHAQPSMALARRDEPSRARASSQLVCVRERTSIVIALRTLCAYAFFLFRHSRAPFNASPKGISADCDVEVCINPMHYR